MDNIKNLDAQTLTMGSLRWLSTEILVLLRHKSQTSFNLHSLLGDPAWDRDTFEKDSWKSDILAYYLPNTSWPIHLKPPISSMPRIILLTYLKNLFEFLIENDDSKFSDS